MRKLGLAKPKQVKPINPMAGGVETVADVDEPMETNFEPETVIGIKRERPIRKAAAAASQRIIDLSSPTKKSSPAKSTVVIRENDKRKCADVVPSVKAVPCVEESWEATAIEKKDSKSMSRLLAKYRGKLVRDKVKGVWEDRVIIGVLWNSKHDQYMVNTHMTSGKKDEAEYVISSVRRLII